MCKLCDEATAQGRPAPVHLHANPAPAAAVESAPSSPPRRNFLRASAVAGASAGLTLAACGGGEAVAHSQATPPPAGVGEPARRTLIRGGAVMSMDPAVGNFATGDVLLEGRRIVAVGANLSASGAAVIEAAGMVVMPGFVDTHHHQFETALRSFLADGVLLPDGRPDTAYNYYETILQKFSTVYRPQDVYINELYGSLSQIDAGVTTVMDVSQIHHSPEHSDAAIEALRAAGRRAVFGYFEGQGPRTKYPQDARRIRSQWFSSSDQLLSMVMGGEIYLPGYEAAWEIGRELNLPIALHVVGTFGMQPTFDKLGAAGWFGPDNIFIHMTGMSEAGWRYAADAGAHVSLAVPIEMQMRHGTPPTQTALDLGMQPSLSTDVECTMTADMFTQMRSVLTLQRMFANEKALRGESYPRLLTSHDAIRFATIEGARGLKLEARTGSLTPGKEADIILLDATALNVAPLNHVPGAVVTLMERSNVSTVLVAGQIRKWRGELLGFDLPKLRRELEASRDHLFDAAGIARDLFRA
ncbi:amidohydrolase family protein [Caldimonas tepidiphila]|uniref:amidohydrolase family protein n=1 Tax=Caldimonas tepidiphila TaxID=2315841 RepID=UPI00196A5024|nr:amidohydrolase family protein [Caldimonas tepidiphila]